MNHFLNDETVKALKADPEWIDLKETFTEFLSTGDGFDCFADDVIYPLIFGRSVKWADRPDWGLVSLDPTGRHIAYSVFLHHMLDEILADYVKPARQDVAHLEEETAEGFVYPDPLYLSPE